MLLNRPLLRACGKSLNKQFLLPLIRHLSVFVIMTGLEAILHLSLYCSEGKKKKKRLFVIHYLNLLTALMFLSYMTHNFSFTNFNLPQYPQSPLKYLQGHMRYLC